ncbi:MAG: MoxR family ATPase [Candidatus Taylorbacteria bacterium]|nr:MoxR family ATPase [Candidatus Taylorbacteria bacterium]
MAKEPMTLEEALDGVNLVKKNTAQTLFGIDDAIEKAALGMFTRVTYTREDNGVLYKDYAPAPVIMTARHGVGKTDLARNMAFSIGGKFSFVSGQPEMSASKIMGRDLYVGGQFFFAEGDINVHVFLFDELPRTPPKVLAPFFQAMEERQAIVDTYDMKQMKVVNKRISLTPINDDPNDKRLFFWPISTGNLFEHEGNYEVPEAMWDRYSIHFGIDYPDREKEKLIDSKNVCGENKPVVKPVISLEKAHAIGLFFAENVQIGLDAMEYIQCLTENSRPREKNKEERREFAPRNLRNDVDKYVKAGTSPRYNYHYKAIVRSLAAFRGRLYVTLDDVKDAYYLVATHRILLNHVARGRNITQQEMASEILRLTPIPPSGSRSTVSLTGNSEASGFLGSIRNFLRV